MQLYGRVVGSEAIHTLTFFLIQKYTKGSRDTQGYTRKVYDEKGAIRMKEEVVVSEGYR